LSLIGTLGGVEMGLAVAGVPHKAGGTQAAMDYLKSVAAPAAHARAAE
jgi:alanine-glyoxylate transaminase/serine-glyoxylate transaminase/serine-pyruvate transaminase